MQETLAEQTYQELRRWVLEGGMKPGTQLIYRTLASQMKVSLAPVREAIQRLAAEGLIENIPGAGAFVRTLSKKEIEELYIVREALESTAAAEAALNRTGEQANEIEAVCRDADAVVEEIRKRETHTATKELQDRWLNLEERFHDALVEAARNGLLKKSIQDCQALHRVFASQRGQPDLLTLDIAEPTCRDHAALASAVRKRDAEQARLLMVGHIRQGRRSTLDALRQAPRDDG